MQWVIQSQDGNGTSVTTKYTPTVTAVTPTGEDVNSIGKQGKVQTGTQKFTEGMLVPLKVDAGTSNVNDEWKCSRRNNN